MIARPQGWDAGGRLGHVPDVEDVQIDRRHLQRALGYVRPHRGPLALALALTIFAAGMSLLAPYLVKVAIDEHIAVGDVPGLTVVVLLTLLAYLANYLATSRQIVIISQVGQQVLMTMRAQLFRHLHRLPLAYFQRNPNNSLPTCTGSLPALPGPERNTQSVTNG